MADIDLTESSEVTVADAAGTNKLKVNTDGSLQPRPVDLILSVAATAGVGLTATLPAVTGQYHYIGLIYVSKIATANITGTATPINVTSTNLASSFSLKFGTAQLIGELVEQQFVFPHPVKSTAVNTATTLVCPATANIIWKIQIVYYTDV